MAQERFFTPTTFAAIPEEYARFERARVVILPVPYGSTGSGRAGSGTVESSPAATIMGACRTRPDHRRPPTSGIPA